MGRSNGALTTEGWGLRLCRGQTSSSAPSIVGSPAELGREDQEQGVTRTITFSRNHDLPSLHPNSWAGESFP